MPQTTNASSTSTDLVAENQALHQQVQDLTQQLDWFKRQLFGEKSEKRLNMDPQVQPDLLTQSDEEPNDEAASVPEKEVLGFRRRKKQRSSSDVNDTGLRFDDSVPRTVIRISPSEGFAGDFDVIGEKVSYRLCQHPGNYQLLEFRRQVIKRKHDGVIFDASMPPTVLDRCYADVSLLAGLLIDKFLYHLPLYRQHQRLKAAGVTLSRGTLGKWAMRSISLLEPIYDAQFKQILQSKVLAMDETPIKAGKKSPGKLKQGYFWPLYGEHDEIVFPYTNGRGKQHLDHLLQGWRGETLLSDGYAAYERYTAERAVLTHAECWSHTRRYFERAKDAEPTASAAALALIGELYRHEQAIRDRNLVDQAKLQYRTEHSLPAVQSFWQWCDHQLYHDLEPSNPLSKAVKYALARQESLQVFLSDPDVPIDTNHLERALRPIPMGRRNWLFCWTELGAKHVGIIQSLLVTCKLHGIDPSTYLIDVLQRVGQHPAKDVVDLTPRIWKQKFADNPLKSDLETYPYPS